MVLAIAAVAMMAVTTPQLFTVTGKITNEKNIPIAGATVAIESNGDIAMTDSSGSYSIKVKNEQEVLVFSAPGYLKKKITVKKKRKINVILKSKISIQDSVLGNVNEDATDKQITIRGSASVKYAAPTTVYGYSNGKAAIFGARSGIPAGSNDFDREGYDFINEQGFLKSTDNPLSTFSIDVDAASYSNIRRFLNDGQLPPAGAVRIEEMVNYFRYDYPQPEDEKPFFISTEISGCPWNKDHRLAMIGMQGKSISTENLPQSNLVFLVDVSGSMMDENKLPLVKQSLKLLTDQLRSQDHVAIVVYAGNAGLVLPSTGGIEKSKIKDAIDALEAGGSTAGGEGIQLAYKTAEKYFSKNGNNRVVLCTDGDFNVGLSSDDELERLIEKERESGVYLTVLGFGMGNYQDAKMQKLADRGNGNHAYIDQVSEAKKVLIREFGGTLFAIANDVKLQVEFNPALVQGYRLIGYENRMLKKEDFNDDKKDAGELGSGHTVTALYEIIPSGVQTTFLKNVDALKYQEEGFGRTSFNKELMTIKFRYKRPGESSSTMAEFPVKDEERLISDASENYRFASAVAEFGMILRNSEFKQHSSFANVLGLAKGATGKDHEGYRKEFISLVKKASEIAPRKKLEDEDVSSIK